MTRIRLALLIVIGAGLVTAGFGVARSLGHGDDEIIMSQLATVKQRKDFFRTLTPERKSALWRKHYATELAKHPELTPEQKAVVELAIALASPDIFKGNVPDPCGPGSVFRTAGENAFKDAFDLRREIFGQPADPLPKFAHANKSQDDDHLPDCECNMQSWCNSCACTLQCGKWGCYSDPNNPGGCGCFWNSKCDMRCSTCL